MTTPRPQPDISAVLWTDAEAAAALYTTRAAVERARMAGQLRAVRIGSGPWRYRPADVRAYVDWLAGVAAPVAADTQINRPRAAGSKKAG